jgi:glycogen debranching enzyme
MMAFGPEICRNLEAATQREWLETNGIGGFASSTIIGLNTRRYHGLLTAALTPPVGRFVLSQSSKKHYSCTPLRRLDSSELLLPSDLPSPLTRI